jgi:hypothetical protein
MGLHIPRTGRLIATATLLSLSALTAACGGGDHGTGPNGGGGGGIGDLAGDYYLAKANDQPLPAIFVSDVCAPAKFTGGGIRLGADGTFQMAIAYVNNEGTADGFQDHGTVRRQGDQLLFTSEAWGDTFEGELDEGLIWADYDFCNDNQGADLWLGFGQ